MTFVVPSTTDLSLGRRVSRMPKGTPIATASSIDTPTSHRCSPVNIATSCLCVSRKFKPAPSVMKRLLSGSKNSRVFLGNGVRRVQEFSRFKHASQASLFHQRDPITQHQRFANVVGYEYDRLP